jgi:hypothetical protein
MGRANEFLYALSESRMRARMVGDACFCEGKSGRMKVNDIWGC